MVEMNTNVLKQNRGLFAVILGVAIVATVGLSAVYAQTAGSDQTQKPQIKGSIDLPQIIKSSVKTNFIDAAKTAASSVPNGNVIAGSLSILQGSVVYQFKVIDSSDMVYSVIVDAGNGLVLNTSTGHQMQFGGFGMFDHGMKGKFGHMDGQGWEKRGLPEDSSTPSGSTNPTSQQTQSLIESQV